MEEEKKQLSDKDIIFCEEYIKTMNASKSYSLIHPTCTYNTSRTEGAKLLAKPHIQAYLQERFSNIKNEKIADADEVLEFLTNTLRGEVKDQLGFETAVKDRIKAGELLGKRYSLFEEEKNKGNSTPSVLPVIKLEIVDNSELESTLYESDKK